MKNLTLFFTLALISFSAFSAQQKYTIKRQQGCSLRVAAYDVAIEEGKTEEEAFSIAGQQVRDLVKKTGKSKEEIKEFIKNAARDPHAEKLTNQTSLTIELSAEPD